MNLEIEVNYKYCYVEVIDTDTGKTYFSQGEEGYSDIETIDTYGEEAFLDTLAGSGYFD